MEFIRMTTLAIYIILIPYQVISVHGEHETFRRNDTCVLWNYIGEFRQGSNNLRDCGLQLYDPHSKGHIYVCLRAMRPVIIAKSRKELVRNHTKTKVAGKRIACARFLAVRRPNSNMRWTYINSYTYYTAFFKHSERPLVITRRCFEHFGDVSTLVLILNVPYSSETKSGRGVLYTRIRYMANMYDINFWKVSIRYIIHGFSLNRLNCVTLPLDTDGFSYGQEHGSKFRLVVTSEEISKHYNRCITDKDNMKNVKCNATDAKDNSEKNYVIYLTVIFFLLYTFEVESCFHDKFDQDRPVECNGDQNSNGRKENGHTCDTLPKQAVGQPSILNDEREAATNGNIVNNGEMMIIIVETVNVGTKKAVRIYKTETALALLDANKEASLAVGQPSILNEERVATNGNTVNDDEVKTNDAIDTVEIINVGIGRDVSEYLTPETDQLEVLEATKEAVGQPSILNEERVATNGNTVNDDEVKTNDAIDTVETVNVGIGRDVSEYLTPETNQLEMLEATKEAVGQPSILNEERVATNGNTVNDDEVKTNDAIDTVETVNVGIGRDVSEYLTPETNQLEMLEETKEGGAAQEDELVCKICYMEEISVVFLPCSHMLACESCSKLLERCAVCRAVIKAMLKAEIK
ncbi:uncharacterized protein LOC132721662 isoform X2 [Ruditapes philippinarum]|uniref:uncharacterized protein LOC132721662 isoform X2 n=1 Tax=Ruditapes philippinarum TaxID=129788 RepID=UPI00295BF1E1|nr:uncharacterized protein LOC132721662 isoform X2 [Ruditapes philippinarum]